MKVGKMMSAVSDDDRPKLGRALRAAKAYGVPDEAVERMWHTSDTVDEMAGEIVAEIKLGRASQDGGKLVMLSEAEGVSFFFEGHEVAFLSKPTAFGKVCLTLYGFHDKESGLAKKTKEATFPSGGNPMLKMIFNEVARHRGLVLTETGAYVREAVEQPLIHEFEET